MSSCINIDNEPCWSVRGRVRQWRLWVGAVEVAGRSSQTVCTKSNYQSRGINIPAVWQVTAPSFQPPPVPAELHRQHGMEQLNNTTCVFSCLPHRLFLKEYWDIYGGKTATERGGFGRSVGSTSHRGLFFGRSARAAWQAASVNGAFFSCLSAGVNMLIVDKVALIVPPPPPIKKRQWGGNAFCLARLPPNSGRFVSLWHKKRPNQTSLNCKTNRILLNFAVWAKGIKVKADPWDHF